MRVPALLLSVLTVTASLGQGRVESVWNGIDALAGAETANAMSVAVRNPGQAAGRAMRALFLHPQNNRPATAAYTVTLPALAAGERLVFSAWPALADGVKPELHPMDGVGLGLEIDGQRRFRVRVEQPGWTPACADLTALAGRTIKLVLFTDDGGGQGNVSYDWAMFGQPQILRFAGNALADGRAAVLAGAVLVDAGPAGTLTLTPADAAGNALGEPQAYPWAADQPFCTEFDLSSVPGAEGVRVDAPGAKAVRVGSWPPQVRLRSLGAAQGVVFQGHATELRAAVENVGRAPIVPAHGLTVAFEGLAQGRREVARLAPGDTATVSLPLPDGIAEPGDHAVSAKATWREAEGLPPQQAEAAGTVRVTAAMQLPHAPGQRAESRAVDGTWLLQNRSLRLAFLDGGAGPVAMYLGSADGWKLVATAPAAAELVAQAAGRPVTLDRPQAEALGADGVRFRYPLRGAPGSLELTARLEGDDRVRLDLQLTSPEALGLSALRGPSVLAGDGAGGEAKQGGLFPGLEYLRADDVSSSKRDFAPPLHLRLVPDPYKITVPLMAVATPDALVGVMWDPNARWHGDRFLAQALFASPNFADGQANHRMQLFVPAGPDLVAENTTAAKAPYAVPAGEPVRLTQWLLLHEPTGVLEAMHAWAALKGGWPAAEAPPRDLNAELELSRWGFLHTVWDDEAKKSKHCVDWANANAPQFAALLHLDALLTGSREAADRAKLIIDTTLAEQGEAALASGACCHILRGNLPFWHGHLDAGFAAIRDGAYAAIGSMAPDGSWGFNRPEDKASLGELGARELGTCAGQAASIWRWVRMSGDPVAEAAGRLALDYMSRFVVPAGAQGWECPIHEPDILAAAHAVRAYVEAYEATGETLYLDSARYWAETGLPFLYLWDDGAKPGMRYASIPVFGSTFMTHSWLGVPVQWNGLVYAYGLQQLARHDRSLPWRQIAEGITHSAMYQQFGDEEPRLKGVYPDGWYGTFTKRSGPFINPEDIVVNALALAGHDLEPRTATAEVGGARVRITSAAQVDGLSVAGDEVRFTLRRDPAGTSCTVIPGVARPEAVTIDGRPATFGDDLDADGVNATYRADQATLYLRTAGAAVPVAIRGLKPAQPAAAAAKTRWDFDQGVEGWTADHACRLSTAGGALVCAVEDSDPYFSTRGASFPAAEHDTLVVRARANRGNALGLFWGTDRAAGTSEDRHLTVPLAGDGQWHEVVFNLAGRPGWTGTVNLLRLDPEPADLGEGATVEIDWIEAR